MKILGLIMVHNGERGLAETLDAMSEYCDCIYMLNDRSVDKTYAVAGCFEKVKNIFSADAALPQSDWYFPESLMYELLYRMADFYQPDWIVQVDDDEFLKPGPDVRNILGTLEEDVSCVKCPKISSWNDPQYPALVPLMGKAINMSGAMWRYYPGLRAGTKPLHNQRYPVNIETYGRILCTDDLQFVHNGWDTLEKRIRTVDKYMQLDPRSEFNHGMPYDKGLLFGYSRNDVAQLVRDYELKYEAFTAASQR